MMTLDRLRAAGPKLQVQKSLTGYAEFFDVTIVNEGRDQVTVQPAARPSPLPATITLNWQFDQNPADGRFELYVPDQHTMYALYPADHIEVAASAYQDAVFTLTEYTRRLGAVQLWEVHTADTTQLISDIIEASMQVENAAVQVRRASSRSKAEA